MFAAESSGLDTLAKCATIKVPQPICTGSIQNQAFLVTEYIPLSTRPDPRLLGEQLAALHACRKQLFGWTRDNYIGATPQTNTEAHNWISFWRTQRLGFQLQLAARNGYRAALEEPGNQLQSGCESFFADYSPIPSLLHGDLWSGNVAGTTDRIPVIFDPAVYFGDRETDIAMTELFGGFDPAFYDAYNANWPLDSGYQVRKHFYNLYHILNHLNLFGEAYLQQAKDTLHRLLAELG